MSETQERRAVLFFDTSALLHFRFPAEVDWCAELQCSRVLVVIPPVVLWELNDKKDSGTKIQKSRAAKVLKRLRDEPKHQPDALQAWSDLTDIEQANLSSLRAGVDIYFDPIEPDFDPADRLSATSQDDRLVASVLRFARANTNIRVEVRARDFGLEMKMKRFQVRV